MDLLIGHWECFCVNCYISIVRLELLLKFLNIPNLLLIGMLAAEATFGVLHNFSNMEKYWDALRNSWIWEELYGVRNYRPVSSTVHSISRFLVSKIFFPQFST